MLLTRTPLYSSPEGDFRVRLACLRHAASVDSEPGSNSRLEVLILEHHRNWLMSDDDSFEFCTPRFIARASPSKVISWDTLYLVFKDRFLFNESLLRRLGFASVALKRLLAASRKR